MPAIIKIPSLHIEILNHVQIHNFQEVNELADRFKDTGWVLPTLKESEFMFSLSDLKGTIFEDLRSGLKPSRIWLNGFYMKDTPKEARMFYGVKTIDPNYLSLGWSYSLGDAAQTILVRYPDRIGSKITLM